MPAAGRLWSVRVVVPDGAPEALDAAEAALAPHAVAVSLYEVDGGPSWAVEALCERRPGSAAIGRALSSLGLAQGPSVARVPPRDWVAESERRLPPLRAGRFFVHGSHVTGAPPRGTLPLRIDAGLAFGTGRHETTRGCLLALDRLARRRRFERPLDLGCGSGILALAMALLWRAPVLAADNDPQAVRVARENAAANGLARLVRVVRSSGYSAAALRRHAPFDLVVANILARPLCRLARGLDRRLAPDGVAVLSGLLVEQEAMVLAAHARHGLALADRRRYGGWSVLVMERAPGADRIR